MMLDTKNGYATIKQIAKTCGCRVSDLLALSPANDPFYAGSPAGQRDAKWFADIWERFTFGSGTHLRRIHYRVVSQDPPIVKPNGEDYVNTQNDWKYLGSASLAARYLGLIPTHDIIDRRNPDPMICYEAANCYPSIDVVGETPSIFLPPHLQFPSLMVTGFERQQDFLVEIWCEKSTMNDILLPLARSLKCNLVTGVGEMSETACRNVIERAISAERPTRLLYISDFDPAGRSMPKAVARKIEYHLHGLDVDIQLQPIVLTPEQCEEYSLPRTPIKKTERRAAKFEARFGKGATELDALEAIHPGELEKIVREEAERYIDPTLSRRVSAEETAWDRRLDGITASVHSHYGHAIGSVQERYSELLELAEKIEDDCEELFEQITEELESDAPVIDEDAVPTAGEHDPHENPLFDSQRRYMDQLDHYKAWKEGSNE